MFRNQEKIGGDSWGVVYRAIDENNNSVALKFPHPLYDPNSATILEHQTKIQSKFAHRYITPITLFDHIDFGKVNLDVPFIVMPLADTDLNKLITGNNPLSIHQAASLSEQIAEGLWVVHQNGIIYGDVKPQNILLYKNNEGFIGEITDFGVAMHIDDPASGFQGNPLYAAPEQLSGIYTPAVDQYGWAAGLVYPGLTGENPFPDTEDFNLAHNPKQIKPRSFASITPDKMTPLHEAIEEVAFKALQENPNDRYFDMGTLLDDLRYKLAQAKIKATKQTTHLT